MAGILDEVMKQVEQMSEEELRAEFIAAQKAKAEQKERQLKYNASPEAKEKRSTYQKNRLAQMATNPELKAKIEAQRKAYHGKPEVKARMKEYRDARNAKIKAVLARAKELGIDVSTPPAEATPA
jgi:hypothetical protein